MRVPEKTGYEICEYVKQQPELASVPVILLVGAFEPFDEKEAARVHADDHLKKPFAPQMLVETIRKFVVLEPSELKGRESTGPEASEVMPPPPAPAETQWHAEQSEVIPLAPPVDFSRAVTRPLVEEPPPLPSVAREEPQESAVGRRVEPAPPVAEFPNFMEESEAPLEISHVHEPPADESVMETQRLMSGPEMVPPPPSFERVREEASAAAEPEPWEAQPPLTLEEPPVFSPGPTTEVEPVALSEPSREYLSELRETPVLEPSESAALEASAERGFHLNPAFPVAEEFSKPQEVLSPPSLPETASESAPAVTAPEMATSRTPHAGESEELGSALTDEFKEFQRELVRHAPNVLPQLVEEPLAEEPPFQPSPVEGVAPVEEEVMGPPAPFMPREEIPAAPPLELAAIPTPPPLDLGEPFAPPLLDFAETPAFAPPELAEASLPVPAKAGESLPAPAPSLGPGELSQEMIDAIARRVVEQMSSRVVEEIAWEVVPEIAETLLRKNIAEKK